MIARYTLPEIANVWSDQTKFEIWLQIEILACEAQAQLGLIPADAVEEIKAKARFDLQRIAEIESVVHHDVIAFVTNVAENVGPAGRYIHRGLTSSDVIDTAFAVQLRKAGTLILEKLHHLATVLAEKALAYKETLCVGRTHGVHAEPTTFGLKFARWYMQCRRNITRLTTAIEEISYGQISGAVGTYQHLPPAVEAYVCEKLDLKPAPISTQIIDRDHHLVFLSTLATIGTMIETIALEIRHLQRTEVLEAEEFFAKGQKGSSAMPHKKNPIICERLCGLARLLRSNVQAAFENVALWHERDISHSSVERIIFPDSTIALYYMLHRTIDLLQNLVVHPEKMKDNLELTHGLIYSQAVLLALVDRGLSREEAYQLVQRHALRSWEEKRPLLQLLQSDPAITQHLSSETLATLFNPNRALRYVDTIFERCGLLDKDEKA